MIECKLDYLACKEPASEPERWFELSVSGELSHRQYAGGQKRGVIDLETCKIIPNKTDAKGICTPFFFRIHTFVNSTNHRRGVFNLSAPTQASYLNWLKALKAWIGVKRPAPIYLEDKEAFEIAQGVDEAL